MTAKERWDFFSAHPHWGKSPAGRWAREKKTGWVPAETEFIGDDPTPVDGRVCIPLAPATGPRLRDAFRLRGAWYIPADKTALLYYDRTGRAVLAAATDKGYLKALAIV